MFALTDSSAVVGLVRSQISLELEAPGVVAITSAQAGDGSRGFAHALAVSFFDAGERTLIVEYTDSPEDGILPIRRADPLEIKRQLDAAILDGKQLVPDVLRMYAPTDGGSWSAQMIAQVAATLRERYSYILVDAPQATQLSHTLLWVQIAQKILVTVQTGRSTSADDHRLREMIVDNARCLGVVLIDPRRIKAFVPVIPTGSIRRVPMIHGEHRATKTLLEHR